MKACKQLYDTFEQCNYSFFEGSIAAPEFCSLRQRFGIVLWREAKKYTRYSFRISADEKDTHLK